MKLFEKLTDENFTVWKEAQDNPNAHPWKSSWKTFKGLDINDCYEDTIRMVNSERLILNHLIVIFNIFVGQFKKMLEFKIDDEYNLY